VHKFIVAINWTGRPSGVYSLNMDELKTEHFDIRVRGDLLFVAPTKRAGDWRSLPVGVLEAWLSRQWRERAMDPKVSLPLSSLPQRSNDGN